MPATPSLARATVEWRLYAIVAVAVLVRLPPLFAPTLWYDDAVEGLMSQDVLRGRFPLFFYGQPLHGVADRYLAALVILLLGPTVLALKLAALGLSVVFVWSLAVTTRRIFGAEVALLAALLVAVPPYYLYGWSFDSRGHYPLMLILGAWTLLLGWRILEEGVSASPRRRFVGLGFLAGVSAWTNYLSVTFLAPLALALLVRGAADAGRAWRPLLGRTLIGLGAFVCGVVPVIGYYGGHRLSLVLPGDAGKGEPATHVEELVVSALPQILGVHPDVWGSAYGVVTVLAVALAAGAFCYVAGGWLRAPGSAGARGRAAGLFLGVAVVTLLLSAFTRFGALLRVPRYLLPLYLALPVLLAVALHDLARLSRPLARLAVAAITLNHLLGSLITTPLMAEGVRDRAYRWSISLTEQLALLDRVGVDRVYGGSNVWPYVTDRRVLTSHPYAERMPEMAWTVDAAPRIGWLLRPPTEPLERSLAAVGVRYRKTDGPGFVYLTHFELPAAGYADLDPAGWSAVASPHPLEAPRAYDRSLDTAWAAPKGRGAAAYYELDLGRAHRVGMLSWLPASFRETPEGLRVTASLDGRAWHEVASVAQYVGPLYWSGTHPFQRVRRSRVEVRFPAIEARYVRVDLSPGPRAPVSIRELFVGMPVAECRRDYDPVALTRHLWASGVRFVHADHWFSAAIRTASGGAIGVLPSNWAVTAYRHPSPDPDLVEAVRLTPRAGLVVEDCPAPVADGVEAVLRAAGVGFARHSVAGFVVFSDLTPLVRPGVPAAWHAAEPGGDTIDVRLDGVQTVGRVVVECRTLLAAPVAPSLIRLEASGDGVAFSPVPFRLVQPGKLRMSGSRLFRDPGSTLVLETAPRSLRALRIVGTAPGAPCAVSRVGVGGPA